MFDAFLAFGCSVNHVIRKCGEKSETSERNPIFANKTAGGSVVAIRCGRHAGILPHTSGWTQINGVNAHGLECHIELPIGNKTNIVSIMLTKGWL